MTPTRPPKKSAAAAAGDSLHPTADAWLAQAQGRVSGRAGTALDQHRARCKACHAQALLAARVARAVDRTDLEPVPASLRRAAERMFSPVASAPAHATYGRLRLIPPAHGFAAGAFAGAFTGGVRRAGEALRRCALEGGSWRLELEWTPYDRAWHLRGRVVGADVGGAASPSRTIVLEGAEIGSRRVRPGPRGFFGPVLLPSPEVRVTLQDADRSFRSPWLPRAPRRR